jgi:hypothetical protein
MVQTRKDQRRPLIYYKYLDRAHSNKEFIEKVRIQEASNAFKEL